MLLWVRVLSSDAYDGRLIWQVATESVTFGRGSWLRKISMCYKEFGWQEIGMKRFVKHRGEGNTGIYCLEEDLGGMGDRSEA